MNWFKTTSTRIAIGALAALAVGGCRTLSFSPEKQTAYRMERHFNGWRVLVQESVPEVHAAIVAALKDLELKPITDQADKLSATVDGMFADNMDFEIKLESMAPKLTRMTIKCGVLGDEARSKSLFRAIEKHF